MNPSMNPSMNPFNIQGDDEEGLVFLLPKDFAADTSDWFGNDLLNHDDFSQELNLSHDVDRFMLFSKSGASKESLCPREQLVPGSAEHRLPAFPTNDFSTFPSLYTKDSFLKKTVSPPEKSSKSHESNKRRRVKIACVPCHSSKVSCDEGRPCHRCVRMGMEDKCISRTHRKMGRPSKR